MRCHACELTLSLGQGRHDRGRGQLWARVRAQRAGLRLLSCVKWKPVNYTELYQVHVCGIAT